jgi:predicted DNA-binding transcriptional regulator YafY
MATQDGFWQQVRAILPAFRKPTARAPPPVVTQQPAEETPGETYGPNTAEEIIRRVQYAGKHRVQLRMVYNSQQRNIEVYSFRRRRTGLLLFAYCHLHSTVESFRMDRIQNIAVTDIPYQTNLFPVEF